MAYIEVIPPEDASGTLKEIYDEAAGRRGRVANVLQVHSLMPETLRSHLGLYMDVMYGKGPLSRMQREAIAVVVSAANQCPYCIGHHSEALNKYLKDDEETRRVAEDFESSGLDDATKALCRHAWKLTRTPGAVGVDDVAALRAAGWDDQAVLHTTLVTGYFNFVNRLVIGTGAELEGDFQGYKH